MIILKANEQLKRVFLSLIKTLGTNVVWNHIFVITNNTLILPGKVRSLFFNYDTKQLYTNLIDLTIEESQITEIINDELLINTINMTLYAFGKWGAINGLTVEKDYSQLNYLFRTMLKEINVEPSLRDDNFRFYKNKILISYEDVIQDILDLSNKKENSEDEADKEDNPNNSAPENDKTKETQREASLKNSKEQEDSNPAGGTSANRWKTPASDEDYDDEYRLGLWHNMRWSTKAYSFTKTERSEEDANNRLGNSFYPTGYKCPICGEKLFISLYPVGSEFPIETDEGRVYLARAYTCNTCNCFYTPRPDKLLQEGDVYVLEFDEDRSAYEDYLELLGNAGERCANYKFNQYEAQYIMQEETPPETLEEACEHIDSMSEEELDILEDKVYSGFYPQTAVETFYPHITKKLSEQKKAKHKKRPRLKKTAKKDTKNDSVKTNTKSKEKKLENTPSKEKTSKQEEQTTSSKKHTARLIDLNQDFSKKTPDELKYILSELEKDSETLNSNDSETSQNPEANIADNTSPVILQIKNQLNEKLKEKYDAHLAVVTRMSPKQLSDLKAKIEAEQTLSESEKEPYLKKINTILFEEKEKTLKQKAESCKGRSYQEIERVIKEIKESDVPETVKRPLLEMLTEQRKKSGEKEVEYLMSTLPPQLNKKQFEQFLEKLHQYKDVDISPYEKQLEQRRSLVEQQEINAFITRANKANRNALFQLYNDLKEQGFSEKNLQPFLDKIHNKIYKMDEAKIQELCPSIMDMTFEDGLEAMEKIQNGMFLPELKMNALEMLDKRLTKLKTDECDQLVRKLKRELQPHVKDYSKLHFYEARKAMRGDLEESEVKFIEKILNSYASNHGQYEYPILIVDASRFPNGKEGFVLTPDHIFYNGFLHSGTIPVLSIDSIEDKNGFINKGVFVEKETGDKAKLPLPLPSKEWKGFASVLNEFVNYLQEKPESRKVSYLAKESHEKKCCYRCGYVYTGGNICPKCGSKANQ